MKTKLYLAYTIKVLLIILAYGALTWGVAGIVYSMNPCDIYWNALLMVHLVWLAGGVFAGILIAWHTIMSWVNRTIKMNRTTYTRRDR